MFLIAVKGLVNSKMYFAPTTVDFLVETSTHNHGSGVSEPLRMIFKITCNTSFELIRYMNEKMTRWNGIHHKLTYEYSMFPLKIGSF